MKNILRRADLEIDDYKKTPAGGDKEELIDAIIKSRLQKIEMLRATQPREHYNTKYGFRRVKKSQAVFAISRDDPKSSSSSVVQLSSQQELLIGKDVVLSQFLSLGAIWDMQLINR